MVTGDRVDVTVEGRALSSRLAESASDPSELTVAFIRDVTPLLGPLYWQALRMTRQPRRCGGSAAGHDAEGLRPFSRVPAGHQPQFVAIPDIDQ